MNRHIVIVIWAIVGFMLVPAGAAENWKEVESQIDQEKQRAERDAALTENLVHKSRAQLIEDLEEYKSVVKKENSTLDSLKQEFEVLLKREETLNEELAVEHQEVEAVEGTVRGAAKEAATLIRDNPITPEYPGRIETVATMLDSKRFPGLEGIGSLVVLYFDELKASGDIVRRSGAFVGADGRNVTGDIMRVGRFTSYFRNADGTVGFLRPEASGERLVAIPGEVPRLVLKSIKAFFGGNSNVAPIDPSGGAVFAQLTEKMDLREFMELGGIVMWPILFAAILAVLIIIERLIVLGTTKANTDKIMEKINELAKWGKWKECRLLCEEKKSIPTCRMLLSAMAHIGTALEALENALQEGILREMPRLERFLATLSMLAVIAPLLGLLGTVTGMIRVFRVITMVGTGDPRMMSGGISEALLTTEFGLMVAIPIMVIHHFLERRVDTIVGDMEEKGTAFAVTLIKNGAVIAGDANSAS